MWFIHRISLHLILGIALQLLFLKSAFGHSQRRSPVPYISLVENPRIRTPSQRIHHNSEFEITFSLHGGQQEVRLWLEPNHDIIPKGAKIEYHDENGAVARIESVQRHEIRVFKGSSWVRDESGQGWTYAGWARIVVKQDGVYPLFTGAFVLNHDAHHIQLRSWYLQTKHEFDPDVEKTGDEFMIVYRDSDVGKARFGGQTPLVPRSNDVKAQCQAHNLTFNGLDNPIYHPKVLLDTTSKKDGLWGSFGLDSLLNRVLDKRQNVDGGSIGNSGSFNLRNNIGSTRGCLATKMLALVGVAADCTYMASFESEAEARQHIISQFNSASSVFESTFNITLGIQTLVVEPTNCPGTPPATAAWNLPCSNDAIINDRLNLFSEWRGTRADDGNAFWTLLTTCGTGSAVGLAWIGMLCESTSFQNRDGQIVSGANVVAKTPSEWKVIAHEIGHTMGAVHDCTAEQCAENMSITSQCCPLSVNTCDAGGRYIMNPSTDDRIASFSPCTVGNICGAFLTRSVTRTCLTSNRNVEIITENKCGNGIVEAGEECDCGGTEGCANNQCCDANTCRFINNAVCDDSNDDCCTNCKFSSTTQICRPSTGECDPEEHCSGDSPTCPTDVVLPDGESCSGGMQCASGQCTSRDRQCQAIMGAEYGNNDTSSCNESSCQVQCASPNLGRGFCYEMQQNFLDGTPCEGDGRCKAGMCRGSTTLGEIRAWINRNKPLVIGVSVGVGSLIILCILICIIKACCRRRRVKKVVSPVMPPGPVGRGYPHPQQYYGSGPGNIHQQPYYTRQMSERYG
ncbi:Metallo-peptidase family M12-domain-containing protein [Kalaharituber pfeilii]|nr:Metallo-peptidase family M12-domain-containing protein [Kalaharituber pfeilii]